MAAFFDALLGRQRNLSGFVLPMITRQSLRPSAYGLDAIASYSGMSPTCTRVRTTRRPIAKAWIPAQDDEMPRHRKFISAGPQTGFASPTPQRSRPGADRGGDVAQPSRVRLAKPGLASATTGNGKELHHDAIRWSRLRPVGSGRQRPVVRCQSARSRGGGRRRRAEALRPSRLLPRQRPRDCLCGPPPRTRQQSGAVWRVCPRQAEAQPVGTGSSKKPT